jgi:replicative DNA helicase
MRKLDNQIESSQPTRIDAERSVLGGILLDPAVYEEAAALGLTATDMSLDSHRRIYLCMVSVLGLGGRRHSHHTSVLTKTIDDSRFQLRPDIMSLENDKAQAA